MMKGQGEAVEAPRIKVEADSSGTWDSDMGEERAGEQEAAHRGG